MRRTVIHRVMKLLLCDKVISREKKKCERKKTRILNSPWTYKAMLASISQRRNVK